VRRGPASSRQPPTRRRTLTEAARIGLGAINWPKQYSSGKFQLETLFVHDKTVTTPKEEQGLTG